MCEDIYRLKLSKADKYREKYKYIDEHLDKYKGINSSDDEDLRFNVEAIPSENLCDKILLNINQAVVSIFKGKEQGRRELNTIINKYNFNSLEGTTDFINEIYNEIAQNYDKIEVLVKDRQDLYDFLYSLDYISIEYKLKLGSKSLEQLSPGEKGSLLLIFYLLLDKDNTPLIIDQPEDNLDNQSIYEKLVPYIKYAKKNRQIIVVTHNPNIAVACDSEQVIYAQMDKKTYSVTYEAGSIESEIINKHIVNVLEGTKPAFDLRKVKYIS